jgi:hypothetical protein
MSASTLQPGAAPSAAVSAFVNSLNNDAAAPSISQTGATIIPLQALVSTGEALPPKPLPFEIRQGPTAQSPKSSSKPAWLSSTYFYQAVAAVVTFVLVYLMLCLVRPQFVFDETQGKGGAKDRRFSASRTALWSLGATILAVVLMLVVNYTSSKKCT